jgi:hypothetical protein
MRALLLTVPFLSLLVACSAGSIKGDAADDDGDADTDADADTDVGEDTDTGEVEEEEEPEATIEDWEGDWVGTVTLDAFGDDYFEGCEGELELDVDLDGGVDGDGSCEYGWSGADMEFEGEITPEGELTGTLTIDFQVAGETPMDVSGETDGEDALSADFEGTYERSGWGGDGEVYDVTGSIDLERD